MIRRIRVVLISCVVALNAAVAWAQFDPGAFAQLDSAACVQKAQRILVIDMKSGWWMGDGGDLHHELLARVVRDCPLVQVEYVFLQYISPELSIPGIATGVVGFVSHYPERADWMNDTTIGPNEFPSRPWSEYQQVWLLSGGDHDPTDVPTTDAAFQEGIVGRLVQGSAQPAPGLLVGAGSGHHDHGNKLLAALQLPEMFQTHLTELLTPSASTGDITVLSRVRRGAELSSTHPLFDGLDSIADRLNIAGTELNSDFVLTASDPFQVIGQNTQGEPAIAVRETEARRIVVDAGISRFYATHLPEDAQTYRYLHNLIKYLAR